MTWPDDQPADLDYACQEGNYALGDVMRGACKQEAEEAVAETQK